MSEVGMIIELPSTKSPYIFVQEHNGSSLATATRQERQPERSGTRILASSISISLKEESLLVSSAGILTCDSAKKDKLQNSMQLLGPLLPS
jgi:hypothetical protein